MIKLVHPYIPPAHLLLCHRCGKGGHKTDQCKSHVPKCPICSKEHERKDCTKESRKCPNCDQNHSATYHKCSYLIREKEITNIRILEDIPRHRAINVWEERARQRATLQQVQGNPTSFPNGTHPAPNIIRQSGTLPAPQFQNNNLQNIASNQNQLGTGLAPNNVQTGTLIAPHQPIQEIPAINIQTPQISVATIKSEIQSQLDTKFMEFQQNFFQQVSSMFLTMFQVLNSQGDTTTKMMQLQKEMKKSLMHPNQPTNPTEQTQNVIVHTPQPQQVALDNISIQAEIHTEPDSDTLNPQTQNNAPNTKKNVETTNPYDP